MAKNGQSHWFERIPLRLIWLGGIAAIGLISAVLVYAVSDNRPIEIFGLKIEPRVENPADHSTSDATFIAAAESIIEGLDVPVLVYKREKGNLFVVTANEAAENFYVAERPQLIGMTPVNLHTLIRPWISNFDAWSAEQMDRISKASKSSTRTIGKSRVPMKLVAGHPSFEGDWYITTNAVTSGNLQYVVSRFSN